MVSSEEAINQQLCKMNGTMEKMRALLEVKEKRDTEIVFVTIPEDATPTIKARTFNAGVSKIDFRTGVITNPDGTLEHLNTKLNTSNHKWLHSLSIDADQYITIKLEGKPKRTVYPNFSTQIPYLTYYTLEITCTVQTNIQIFACTNPEAVIGQFRATSSDAVDIEDRGGFDERDPLVLSDSNTNSLLGAIVDKSAGFAYFPSYQSPGRVVKVRLSDFTEVDTLVLDSGDDYLVTGAIDTVGGFAYFPTAASTPGKIVKIRLSDFTKISTLTLDTGENYPKAILIDHDTGFLYVCTATIPGMVVKIRLSDFTKISTLTFAAGEDNPRAGIIDTKNKLAYFTTYLSPVKIVKVDLNTFTETATLTLGAGENLAYNDCFVYDPLYNFAYLGTYTSPAKVAEIRLSDFTEIGVLTMASGVNKITGSAINPATNAIYFVTDTQPGYVIKIQPSDFTLVEALASNSSSGGPGFVDNDDNVYFTARISNVGYIQKISDKYPRRLGMVYGSREKALLQRAATFELLTTVQQAGSELAAANPLPVELSDGSALYAGAKETTLVKTVPIAKARVFNTSYGVAEAAILGADITPTNSPSYLRVYIAVSASGIFRAARTVSGVAVVEDFNGGAALAANAGYSFKIPIRSGDSINFRYSVTGTILTLNVDEIGAAE